MEYHIIKDPIYGSMKFNSLEKEFLKPFIDHPYFQRLRHIKQLSLVDLVFPGAVHTRFSHSLGCCFLASKLYKSLHDNKCSDNELSFNHKLVLIAGLFHDIGHGPFSHTFEKIEILNSKNIKHEMWFSFFCDEIFADIKINNSEFYKKYELNHIKTSLQSLFASINNKNHNFQPKWMQQLISSQIDVDRMDYLLRDSHYCGVTYGNFDVNWLISCLKLVDNEIVLTKKGIGSAEQFLLARRLMHQNIYYNVKANAIACCLIQLLDSLTKSKVNNYIKSTKLYKFLNEIENNSNQENIYNVYKQLVDFDIWLVIRELALEKNNNHINKLARDIYYRNLPEAYSIEEDNIKSTSGNIKNSEIESNKVFIQNESLYSYKGLNSPIYVVENNKKTKLDNESLIINKISDESEKFYFVYFNNIN